MTPPDTANKCVCEMHGEEPICDSPDYDGDFTSSAICIICSHDRACHPIQAPAKGEA